MRRQLQASQIEPMPRPEEGTLFNFLTSKIDATRESFVSMTTTSKADAHSALIRDFNTSNKVWSIGSWN